MTQQRESQQRESQRGARKRLGVGLVVLGLTFCTPAGIQAQQRQARPNSLTSMGGCADRDWKARSALPGFVAQDLAVSSAGALYLTGAVAESDGSTRLATLRSQDRGQSWEKVDDFAATPGAAAGGQVLYVDRHDRVYVLGWALFGDEMRPIVRKSDHGALATWWTSFTGGASDRLGALSGDDDGRIYLALGYGEPGAIGWRVRSAMAGEGTWALEDEYRPSPQTVSAALPRALAFHPDHGLVVAGQLDGNPDRWVVRHRGAFDSAWRTVDLFRYTPGAYGLSPTAVSFARRGRELSVMISGYGVPGGGADDYRWLVRRSTLADLVAPDAPSRWTSEEFQLRPRRSSFALDSAVDANGSLLVAGTALTAQGASLVVRRSHNGGRSWQPLLALPGATSLWDARIAVGPDGSYWVTGMMEEATVLLTCGS